MAASNWHWRTLGLNNWAEQWLGEQIRPLSVDGVSVTGVTVPEGDCELGHRKGKLLTIYDMRVEVRWQGTSGEDKVLGTLTCPELAHDMEENAYEFETSVSQGSGKEADAFRSTAQKKLADLIRPVFTAFPKAMLEQHGNALKAQNDGPGAAAAGAAPTANGSAAAASSSSGSSTATAKKPDAQPVNTSNVRVAAEFRATAEDLFDLLTNESRVPMWSRNPAKIKPEKGAEISLFNGNITGQMTDVQRPKSYTSTWRAPTWPEGWYGTLHTTLTQGSDSTTLELRLTGVPKGEEDAVERNLDVFYIRSLKSIGSAVLPPIPPPAAAAPGSLAQRTFASFLFGGLPFLASFTMIVGLIAAIYLGPTGS